MFLDCMGEASGINRALERWVNRLAAPSHRALLLLLEGGHADKKIAAAVGIWPSNVSRIRSTYERLSKKALYRHQPYRRKAS